MTAPAIPVADEDYDPRPFIESEEWTFAKSMPDEPHFYVVSQRATDRRGWRDFAGWIRRNGEWAEYREQRYRYATVDEWSYWVVGRVINRRALTPDQSQPS